MKPDAVREIIDANSGRLNGRTRLQKSAYLLEVANVGFGFDFSYHYYGPYSEDLALAATDAEALGLINVRWEESQTRVPYAVYESRRADPSSKNGENEVSRRRREIMDVLARYDAISLELAATAHYLAHNGYGSDPWTETKRRKSVKATPERIAKAQQLLDQIWV